ncbi:NUDIX hydrolase [Xenorhabdus griffiniae]|uniref:NUDIX hydrolase n=1 Tax=Xenorhabdus griffiniae TaxID=351672 RepID=UPI002358AAB9|nr:NUDIX domain-containing protein [Xenorhabdus griffiniae]MDC9607147.1 NUDIX domain-containing protein [Xenorhabdus griffiniae]
MIHCASLAYIEDGKVLLVRVRDNKLWYFPGGKIEVNESPIEALVRELSEEINILVDPENVHFLMEVTGSSHDGCDEVRLYIHTLDKLPSCIPGNEISEISWFNLSDKEYMAPAVIKTLMAIENGLQY